MEEKSLNRVLYGLLGIVLYLFYGEVRRAWDARQQSLWDDRYIEAVRSSPEDWHLGWRLEDLEGRLHTQRFWAEALKMVQRSHRSEEDPARVAAQLLRVMDDDRQYFTMTCGSRPDKLVQVGPDEFRDMSDRCRAFSALSPSLLGPQALWEVVPLDGADGTVGFKAMSNGKFLRVKAPPSDAAWDAPWLLETVSPLPGLAERFQLRQVTPETKNPVQGAAVPEEFPAAQDAWTAALAIDDDFSAADRRRRQLLYEEGGFSLIGGDDMNILDEPLNPVMDSMGVSIEEESSPPVVVEPATIKKEHSQTVMIYSELMRGYLQCGGQGIAEAIRGFAGESLLAFESNAEYRFNLTWVPNIDRAQTLLDASNHVASLRAKADEKKKPRIPASLQSAGFIDDQVTDDSGHTIALVVPMTSRGTDMSSVEESPLWFNLFASFVESIDWKTNRHRYTFYLGFDRGDPMYDTGDAWSDLRRSFKGHAVRALQFLQYSNWTIHRIVEGGDPTRSRDLTARKQRRKRRRQRAARIDDDWPLLNLKLYHFEDTLGAPSQAVSGLARLAVKDGNDYIYQLNDDTILVSKDWADDMITALVQSPLAPNLGVAGPLDTNNERILTHAFVHRTHVDIFDAMFPTAFKNWWSDDWISTVYGSRATFARRDVIVTHNVQSQKTGAWNRYDVDHNAHFLLHDQVQRGFVTINAWLRHHHFDTMPLPNICGYSPMMTRIYDTLIKHGANFR